MEKRLASICIAHSIWKREIVWGIRLSPGDVLEETDMYDSTTGKWAKCPCPGLVVPKDTKTIWVRPVLF